MRTICQPAAWVIEAFGGAVPPWVDEVVELAHGRPVKWWSKNPRTGAPSGWPKWPKGAGPEPEAGR